MNPAKPNLPGTGSLRRTDSQDEKAAWDKYFDYLVKSLRDPDAPSRIRAAQMLGDNGGPRAVAVLSDALGDPDVGVRLQAAKALGKIGAPAVEALLGAVRDPDKEVRQAAVKALGQIADPRGVSTLLVALRDVHMDVRHQAAFAISRIGAPAVDALIHLLADPDSNLRANAARILGQIGDARALPALEQMAQLDKARSMGTTGSLVNVAEAAKQAIEKIKSKK